MHTQYLWGVGVNYTATTYAVGLEALIPGNSADRLAIWG